MNHLICCRCDRVSAHHPIAAERPDHALHLDGCQGPCAHHGHPSAAGCEDQRRGRADGAGAGRSPALQDPQQRRVEARQDEQRRIEAEEALRRAREADDQARAAVQRAEEQTQQALDYRKRFGNTPSRRQEFKYKIRAEEEKAIQSQAEAQRAVERAQALSEEARTAVGPAQQPKP